MQKTILSILVSLTALTLLSCSSTPSAGPSAKGLKVHFSQNRELEFEPCGCSISPRGGMNREYNFIQQNGKPELSISFGRTFVAGEPTSNEKTRLIKADFLARALKEIGTTHLVPSVEDLNRGAESYRALAKKTGAELFCSNILDGKTGKSLFARSLIIEKDGAKTAVFGFADPSLKGQGLNVQPYEEALRASLSELKSKPDFIAVVGPFTTAERENLGAKFPEINLFVGEKTEPGQPSFEQYDGDTLISIGRYRGQDVLALDIQAKAGASRVYSPRLQPVVASSRGWWETAIANFEAELAKKPSKAQRAQFEKAITERKNSIARTQNVPNAEGPGAHTVLGDLTILYAGYDAPQNAMNQLIAEMKEAVRQDALQQK